MFLFGKNAYKLCKHYQKLYYRSIFLKKMVLVIKKRYNIF